MSQRRVTISIDNELNERWTAVSKKLKMTKSGMIEDFLREVVPVLEQEQPKDVMKMALKKTAEQIDMTASLFE
jgi:antitoxin component of RelBE/YafQ-DinJ toxin-antitoxin module